MAARHSGSGDRPAGQESVTAREIGARVREHRSAAGWSMRELASRAGVSQPYISKLEAGLLRPSVPALYALAAAFGASPAELLPAVGDGATAELHLPLREDRDDPGPSVWVVAGGPGQAIQVYLFILAPGEGDDEAFRHGGEEVVYVLDGAVTCAREGAPDTLVEAGSSLTIDPRVAHTWRNAGRSSAQFLMICANQG